MGVALHLTGTQPAVEPGSTVKVPITVRNTGSVVDRVTFSALGDAEPWVTFVPESVSLFPGTEGTAEAVISPPRLSTVPAGPVPFGIRAASGEDPAGTVVEEGVLQVGAFSDITLELVPQVASGRRLARSRLAIDNRSNTVYSAELGGSDRSGTLTAAFHPASITVAPGAAEFVRVRLTPVRPFWRGPAVSRPYRVTLMAPPDGVHPAETHVDGSVLQEAMLPRWLVPLAAALAALAVLALVLWFAFLRPQIRSAASREVRNQLASAGIAPAGGSSANGNPAGGSPPAPAGGGGGGGTSPTTAVAVVASGPAAGSGGLTVNGSQHASGNGTTTVYTVPSGRTLQVTDLLVQNAAGDSGTFSVERNGQVLMQWAMANFRDLDYHWIAPTVFGPGTQLQISVSGCSGACHPGIYYAGLLVRTS